MTTYTTAYKDMLVNLYKAQAVTKCATLTTILLKKNMQQPYGTVQTKHNNTYNLLTKQ